MVNSETVEKQLEQWRVVAENEDGNLVHQRVIPAISKLSKSLKAIALTIYDLNEDEDLDDDEDDSESAAVAKKMEALRKLRDDQRSQFDKLSATDRKKIFAALVPQLADAMEAAWQVQKTFSYASGRAAFRAPDFPEATLSMRLEWLQSFARAASQFQPELITLPWLARWAKHAFEWWDETATPLLVASMNQKGKVGDEVFEILRKTVTREDSIGVMSDFVIQSLLACNRPDAWELMEKTLLAAQRQEGLRQSILGDADKAHPEAFLRLLKVILEKDLLRFSSVARCVDIWLGLLWDSASQKVLRDNVTSFLEMITTPSERKKALAGDDAERIYHALLASAFEDAVKTVPVAKKLLSHPSAEIRFVAVWILTLISLEVSERAKFAAIDDENLQVALMAAVKTEGISLGELTPDFSVGEVYEKDSFERLERLFLRLPEKPQKLAAIVWPWTERKIQQSMISRCLLTALGDRPPTRMLPYLKGLHSWHQSSIVRMLAEQKKWDSLTRSTLIELTGHTGSDVRRAAIESLEKQTLKDEELEVLEGFLSRQSAELRQGLVGLLLKGKDQTVLGSADRLTAKSDKNQRLAGLELLRQLAEADRSRKECRQRAVSYRSSRKTLSTEEQTQLNAIDASDRAVLSLDDGLGLMNPDGRSKVVPPKAQKLLTISPAAIACLKSLDELIHKHRMEIVTVEGWRGKEEQPLGELKYYGIPSFNSSKPPQPQFEKFPLFKVWDEWNKSRPAKMKDKDGLELLRATHAANLFGHWQFDDVVKFCGKPEQKKVAVAILGELNAPKLKYESLVEGILEFLLYASPPAGAVDFLLDCSENTYALVPEKMMKELVTPPPKKKNSWERSPDWRDDLIFEAWTDRLQSFIRQTKSKLTKEQTKRIWQLNRFQDEPCPGAPRRRLSLAKTAAAYQEKLATFDDMVDVLAGPSCKDDDRDFSELRTYTARHPGKEEAEILSKTKGLGDLLNQIRDIVLETELARGETPTVTTTLALSLSSLDGTGTLFRIMAALNRGQLKVDRSWRSDAGQTRNATLTHLIKVTYPSEGETSAEFARQAQQAIAEGYCSDERLLQLTFLAPQWSKLVGEYLGWDGFSEGLYWFLAHMNTWYSDATNAAASAEGLSDDPDDDEDDFDDQDDDNDENGTGYKPRKLSAWERLVLERTPLTEEQRNEGAVDVAWFHRTWKSLGEKRWQQMASAAKFAANAAQANKAQFLADVLLGKKPRKDLVEGIQKRFLKENVRLLGLLPLESGAKRDKDVLERYEVLQGYKKYARGLSSLTKPAAMLAVEIGMGNLAQLAGFPDPLRMEWALEAISIRDLAKGPVSVTKEGVTVTLRLDEDAKPQLSVLKGDKPIKSIPSALRKKHAAISELADRATELKRKASRIRGSLENAMCRSDELTATELIQLSDHAIVGPQLAKLVLIGDGIAGYPDKGGKVLRDYDGKLEPIKKSEKLRIAHPLDLFTRGDWDKWQQECFRSERVQPFKQVFRELYVVTKQEKKDAIESQRFAGHQIGPKQAMALWNSRGWHTQDGVCRIFHDLSLIADVSFQENSGTAAEIEGLTLESVSFRRRDEHKAIKLSAVPGILFSEVMRDMDLVVSVAHRGEVDPEASASTVEMRTSLIRETCQLLGMKNVTLKANHALISGYYGEYSLHLGSGGIQRIPGGALTVVAVQAQHRGRIFLPFADDDPRTAEIVSKVLLLARDEEIMDPMILDQLGAPVGKRRSVPVDDPKPTGKKATTKDATGKKSAGDASKAVTGSGYGKRYFEFSEGASNKFWEVELSGHSVTTRWGRIGSDGQAKTKDFKDANAAKAEYDKLVKEKVSKGYTES